MELGCLGIFLEDCTIEIVPSAIVRIDLVHVGVWECFEDCIGVSSKPEIAVNYLHSSL